MDTEGRAPDGHSSRIRAGRRGLAARRLAVASPTNACMPCAVPCCLYHRTDQPYFGAGGRPGRRRRARDVRQCRTGVLPTGGGRAGGTACANCSGSTHRQGCPRARALFLYSVYGWTLVVTAFHTIFVRVGFSCALKCVQAEPLAHISFADLFSVSACAACRCLQLLASNAGGPGHLAL